MDKMGVTQTNNAISVSGFPESVVDWIWEKKRQAFEVGPRRVF